MPQILRLRTASCAQDDNAPAVGMTVYSPNSNWKRTFQRSYNGLIGSAMLL